MHPWSQEMQENVRYVPTEASARKCASRNGGFSQQVWRVCQHVIITALELMLVVPSNTWKDASCESQAFD
jgi:hypothetical protein